MGFGKAKNLDRKLATIQTCCVSKIRRPATCRGTVQSAPSGAADAEEQPDGNENSMKRNANPNWRRLADAKRMRQRSERPNATPKRLDWQPNKKPNDRRNSPRLNNSALTKSKPLVSRKCSSQEKRLNGPCPNFEHGWSGKVRNPRTFRFR